MSKKSRYKRISIYVLTTILIFVFAVIINFKSVKAYLKIEKSKNNYFTFQVQSSTNTDDDLGQ